MASKRWAPEWTHGSLALALTLGLILLGFWLLQLAVTGPAVLLGWLLAINLTAFGYYGYDKWRARVGSRRVPEVILHLLAVSGGSGGAYLGMRVFRHKTIKGPYRIVFWTIVAMQGILLGVSVVLMVRS